MFDTFLSNIIREIIYPIVYILFALAFLYFLWGLFIFIGNSDNAEKRKDGQSHMIWGVIGLFIMVASYGIVEMIKNTLGVTTSAPESGIYED